MLSVNVSLGLWVKCSFSKFMHMKCHWTTTEALASSSNQCTGTIADARSIEAINQIDIPRVFHIKQKSQKQCIHIGFQRMTIFLRCIRLGWGTLVVSVCPSVHLVVSLRLSDPLWVFKTQWHKKSNYRLSFSFKKERGSQKGSGRGIWNSIYKLGNLMWWHFCSIF